MNSSKRSWAVLFVAVAAAAVIFGFWKFSGNGTNDTAGGPETLRVVAILPMTGPGASIGEFLKNGLEMGKEDAERRYAGKLLIDLEILDSKNQPREGVLALQQALATGQRDAVICAMSSVSSAVVPIVEDKGLTTIVTTTVTSQ